MSLPFVNSDVGFSVAESIEDNLKDTVKKELSKLEKENPVIAQLINDWSLLKREQVQCSNKVQCAMCGIMVYKMLQSQAEADSMKKEIKL